MVASILFVQRKIIFNALIADHLCKCWVRSGRFRLRDAVPTRRGGEPGGAVSNWPHCAALSSVGWLPRTERLLRGDRTDAGPAARRHRHRHRAPQVRQAGQSKVGVMETNGCSNINMFKVRTRVGSLLRHSQAKYSTVQQFRVPIRLVITNRSVLGVVQKFLIQTGGSVCPVFVRHPV